MKGLQRILLVILLALTVETGTGYWFLKHRKSKFLKSTSSSSITTRPSTSDVSEMNELSPKILKGGLGAALVNAVMRSPLYYPIVSKARETMISTAESVGIDWRKKCDLLKGKLGSAGFDDERITSIMNENESVTFPEYYKQRFHGYAEGNLCFDSAIEQEIAGKSVGARNFPKEGANGENVLRESYDREIQRLLGTQILDESQQLIVDFGSGTGTSTRRLAALFKNAKEIRGIDLSPYMVGVGRFLMGGGMEDGEWVEDIRPDTRVNLSLGDISSTGLPSGSVDVVSICLVLHELPRQAAESVLKEAYRLLKAGGSLLVMEMDPEAPGYVKLRSNAMLFSVLRSTEPYLDEYFDFAPSIPSFLDTLGFGSVKISAATGRHFAIAATKRGVVDLRPCDSERENSDQHLNTAQMSVGR